MSSKIGVLSADALMTAEQKASFDLIKNGPRGSVPTPFLAMLDAPYLSDVIQAVGVAIRFESSLSDAYRETAILSTAAAIECGYEWRYHAPIAEKVGVPVSVIEATLSGENVDSLDYSLIISFCRECVLERKVNTQTLQRSLTQFGAQANSELIAIACYYPMLATFLKCADKDVPMPTSMEDYNK